MAKQPCATIANRNPVDRAVLALARLLGQAAARATAVLETAADQVATHEEPHEDQHDHDPAQEAPAAQP